MFERKVEPDGSVDIELWYRNSPLGDLQGPTKLWKKEVGLPSLEEDQLGTFFPLLPVRPLSLARRKDLFKDVWSAIVKLYPDTRTNHVREFWSGILGFNESGLIENLESMPLSAESAGNEPIQATEPDVARPRAPILSENTPSPVKRSVLRNSLVVSKRLSNLLKEIPNKRARKARNMDSELGGDSENIVS